MLVVWTRQPLSPDALTPLERDRFAGLSPRRRQQWLVSRHALRVLLGVLGLPTDTERYAFPHRRLSLSHVDGAAVAAGAVAAPPSLAGIGVDLEPTVQPRLDTTHFFLDAHERSWLAAVPATARAEDQTRLWTVKEALFKADPGNSHTVLRDYSTADAAAHHGLARARPGSGADPRTVFGYRSGRLRQAHLSVAASFHDLGPAEESDLSESREREHHVPTVTFADVAGRISSTLSIPLRELTPDTTLGELAADSLLLVEMAVDLQEEFDTMLSQRELRQVGTLGELAALVGVRP